MKQKILINVNAKHTRVAVIENGELQDIYIELFNKPETVGNIYKGKIVRVLPGMHAAFIEIGMERTAFLQQMDFTSKLYEGQDILVQVIKDPVDGKGAKVTTQLSISSRALVFVPNLKQSSISSKIKNITERERLHNLVSANNFIVRTAAVGASSLDIDKNYLLQQWQKIKTAFSTAKTGAIIYKDYNLLLRVFRDIITEDTAEIIIDTSKSMIELQDYISKFMPYFKGNIEIYTDSRPLFDVYRIKNEIDNALQRKIFLKSGGYIIIDQHEAMTTIDVNTGSYVGNKDLEATTYTVNMEALGVICKQIRLRNLGGIIIIDFIDMRQREHMDTLLQELKKKLSYDKIQTKINGFSKLGLVEMTRQRTRPSLQQILCKQCIVCQGNGVVLTDIT